MLNELAPPELSRTQFETIRRLIREICGISIQPGKATLVRGRLSKRLRALGLASFEAYLDLIRRDSGELSEMVNALTTNKTGFFREPEHFDYLRQTVLPAMLEHRGPIRIWSAGCSSGEEPYTIAMVLRDAMTDADWARVRILGTDISTRVLAAAREGVYTKEAAGAVPPLLAQRYFSRVRQDAGMAFRVKDELRSVVRLARLNLKDPWPMQGPFDLIVCRNVMIYFDRQTQQHLVERFWDLLRPGGHLFVGHSESLTALDHSFRYVRPAVYVK